MGWYSTPTAQSPSDPTVPAHDGGMEGNPKRLWWLLVGAAVLIIVGLAGFFSLKRDRWLPIFLSHGASKVTGTSSGQVDQHPFRKKIGPNSYQVPSGGAVSWIDYEMSLGYDDALTAAKSELTRSKGWEEFFMSPIDVPQKSSYTAGEMDQVFLNDNRAVTIFRSRKGSPTRVRVWFWNPSIIEKLF